MDWPYLYVDQYQPTHGPNTGQMDIFDLRRLIADPLDRKPLSVLDLPVAARTTCRSNHRPDGKVIGYAASIGFTDTYDLSDPAKPKLLQRFAAGEHGRRHLARLEPNHDRTIAIESDEYGGGSGVGACGAGDTSGPLPPLATRSTSSRRARCTSSTRDGGREGGQLKATGGDPGKVSEAGAFNIAPRPTRHPGRGCTSHVFWQAPDENR
jgi:hypothetical protein